MNKKSLFTILGFVLFFLGFMSTILYLFAGGIRISFLSFIDQFPTPLPFVLRILMIFGGMILFYISRSDDGLE